MGYSHLSHRGIEVLLKENSSKMIASVPITAEQFKTIAEESPRPSREFVTQYEALINISHGEYGFLSATQDLEAIRFIGVKVQPGTCFIPPNGGGNAKAHEVPEDIRDLLPNKTDMGMRKGVTKARGRGCNRHGQD